MEDFDKLIADKFSTIEKWNLESVLDWIKWSSNSQVQSRICPDVESFNNWRLNHNLDPIAAFNIDELYQITSRELEIDRAAFRIWCKKNLTATYSKSI